MSLLFTPYVVNNLRLKNRVVMAPMCQYSADGSGKVNDWHLLHYATRAVGGVGLVIVEATAVEGRGRISDRDLGIWSDEHIPGLRNLVQAISHHGAKTGIQLAHAGRKSEVVGCTSIAPSGISFSERYAMPHALTTEEIGQVVESFKQAAIRAKEAGFDMVEIHAAHGYLINEFLSPLCNKREDEYGGSRDNRFRFFREVIQAVREVWHDTLFVRISAEEYAEGGNHIEDYVYYSELLKGLGVDLVDVSSGGVVMVPIEDYPGYQVPFSEKIRQEAGIPTAAVGQITTPEQAEEILQEGQADLIALGRELLRNPYWTMQAMATMEEAKQAIPMQYQYGF